MSVHYRIVDDALVLLGHTFPHKETLKGFGARFNGGAKVWTLPNSELNLAQVDEFCRKLGGGRLAELDTKSRGLPPIPGASQASQEFQEIPADTLSISQLVNKAHQAISAQFPAPVWVVGEIQNMAQKGIGFFFNLAEPKGGRSGSATVSIKATLWQSTLLSLDRNQPSLKLKDLLADDMRVRLLCQVGFYKDRGALSLNVIDIDPSYTKGALALAREALLKELRQLGLDQKNKQTTLTAWPFRIGLISAEGSRAKGDFLDQLKNYGFGGEVLFCDAQMQGEKVEGAVIAAIERLVKENCDVIVLTRGGGSAADLRWFDGRNLALAIANCPLPVIAAIGHHEDVCIAEEICFLRQKTPTAAADFIIDCFKKTSERIEQAASRFANNLEFRLKELQEKLQIYGERLAQEALGCLGDKEHELKTTSILLFEGSQRHFAQMRHRLQNLAEALCNRAQMQVMRLGESLGVLEKQIVRADPSPWIAQGWTQLFNSKNEKIDSIKATRVADELHARLKDGRIRVNVLSLEEK